ncbi:MAG: PEP-CTERM sorting domain-containing protein [Phycisphaerae bacterium]
MLRSCLLAVGTVMCLGPLASLAAPIPWAQPNGSTGTFNYSNGGSDLGLFGDPTVVNGGFAFFPTDFRAIASNGNATTTVDRLFFQLETVNDQDIDRVTLSEAGDYSILGPGGVTAAAFLFVTDLDTGIVYSSVFDNTEPDLPIFTNGPQGFAAGIWEGIIDVDLPAGVSRIQVVLNNVLQATSGPQGTAIIEKKAFGGGDGPEAGLVLGIVIPEPTSAMVLVSGLGFGLLRRSRL